MRFQKHQWSKETVFVLLGIFFLVFACDNLQLPNGHGGGLNSENGQDDNQNTSPTVSIAATPKSGRKPLSVQFSSSAQDSNGFIEVFKWSFGDGSTSTKTDPTHQYLNVGTYTARLTVTDNGGASASDTTEIIVYPEEPQEILLQGTGDTATTFFTLEKGLSVFAMSHIGTSNFYIWLMKDNGDTIGLLVNEIGSFDGSTAIGITATGNYLLDVNADGNWTVQIKQPRPISVPTITSFSGIGMKATELFFLNSDLKIFTLSHNGSSNFIVWLLDKNGGYVDLLANEIGSYNGSTAVSIDSSDPHILTIDADGSWSISID